MFVNLSDWLKNHVTPRRILLWFLAYEAIWIAGRYVPEETLLFGSAVIATIIGSIPIFALVMMVILVGSVAPILVVARLIMIFVSHSRKLFVMWRRVAAAKQERAE